MSWLGRPVNSLKFYQLEGFPVIHGSVPLYFLLLVDGGFLLDTKGPATPHAFKDDRKTAWDKSVWRGVCFLVIRRGKMETTKMTRDKKSQRRVGFFLILQGLKDNNDILRDKSLWRGNISSLSRGVKWRQKWSRGISLLGTEYRLSPYPTELKRQQRQPVGQEITKERKYFLLIPWGKVETKVMSRDK